jgi:hypothetical protein
MRTIEVLVAGVALAVGLMFYVLVWSLCIAATLVLPSPWPELGIALMIGALWRFVMDPLALLLRPPLRAWQGQQFARETNAQPAFRSTIALLRDKLTEYYAPISRVAAGCFAFGLACVFLANWLDTYQTLFAGLTVECAALVVASALAVQKRRGEGASL